MNQKGDSRDGSRNAAHCQSEDDAAPDSASAEVHPTSRDLGKKIEKRIRANRNDRGHSQSEDQDGQQENAAS
jgi:hypothetical protein